MRAALATLLIALATLLIALGAAAHAQSYTDRADAERAQAQLEAYDQAKMEQERAAQRHSDVERDRRELQEREKPVPWAGIAIAAVIGVAVWGNSRLKKRAKR